MFNQEEKIVEKKYQFKENRNILKNEGDVRN